MKNEYLNPDDEAVLDTFWILHYLKKLQSLTIDGLLVRYILEDGATDIGKAPSRDMQEEIIRSLEREGVFDVQRLDYSPPHDKDRSSSYRLNNPPDCYGLNINKKVLNKTFSKYEGWVRAIRSKEAAKKKLGDHLHLYADGKAEFLGEMGTFRSKTKTHAFLTVLGIDKNTALTFEDIKRNANNHDFIANENHFFKKEREIDDVLREIKEKLKVVKSGSFPILKRKKGGRYCWEWVEK